MQYLVYGLKWTSLQGYKHSSKMWTLETGLLRTDLCVIHCNLTIDKQTLHQCITWCHIVMWWLEHPTEYLWCMPVSTYDYVVNMLIICRWGWSAGESCQVFAAWFCCRRAGRDRAMDAYCFTKHDRHEHICGHFRKVPRTQQSSQWHAWSIPSHNRWGGSLYVWILHDLVHSNDNRV